VYFIHLKKQRCYEIDAQCLKLPVCPSGCFAILVGDDRTAALALRRLDDVDDQMDGAQERQRILCVVSQCQEYVKIWLLCKTLGYTD